MSKAESDTLKEAEEAGGRRVGERVAQIRGAMKLSQREVDRRAGLSHGYISKLEAGQVPNPGLLQLERIADALASPLTRLLADDDEAAWQLEVDRAVVRVAVSTVSKADLEALQAGIRAIWRSDPQRVSALWVLVRDMQRQVEAEGKGKE